MLAQPPLAEGLPPIREDFSPLKEPVRIKDGCFRRGSGGFFPIGFVFGTGDLELKQAASMGCNAIHFEFPWNQSSDPFSISNYDKGFETIRRAGEVGMYSFPLLSGHYIPSWFESAHPLAGNQPMGNDGQPTGSWTPYSLNDAEYFDALKPFWMAISEKISTLDEVPVLSVWNEPSYGGTWNKGNQFGDYSSHGVSAYRKWLQLKYSDIQRLNEVYKTTFNDWIEVNPPLSREDTSAVAWLDWMQCGQDCFADFFEKQRASLNAVAPHLFLSNKKQTNPWDKSAASSGTNWFKLGASEDIFGVNIYSGSPEASRNILAAACSYAQGKPVVIYEINVMPPDRESRTPDQVRTQLWAPIVGGARGMFIFAMINETEHGFLNTEALSAEARKEYAKVVRNISDNQDALSRQPVQGSVGVIYSTDAALLNPAGRVPLLVNDAATLFRNAGYITEIIPQELCSDDYLKNFALVVIPSAAVLEKTQISALQKYSDSGGKIIAFSGSLSGENPAFLGLESRQNAIGDRRQQSIGTVAKPLARYIDTEISVDDCELFTSIKNSGQDRMMPGMKLETAHSGKILAYNSDSYPIIVESLSGSTVYCGFSSLYSDAVSELIEGITREVLGLKQDVRISKSGGASLERSIMYGLRDEWQHDGKRYLLALNGSFREKTVEIATPKGWKIKQELLHSSVPFSSSYKIKAREMCIFELVADPN